MEESGSSQSGYTGDHGCSVAVREQDRFVPISDISRIMSKAIPENGRISNDAKEFMQKCVSNFISFVTIEASNKCQREKRKTINGDDLVWAMAALGCDEYVQPLRHNLQLYRETEFLDICSTQLMETQGPHTMGCRPVSYGAEKLLAVLRKSFH